MLVREGIVTFFSSLSIKSLLYFEKIMCCLDSKYNRKMCVFDIRLPLYTFHFLSHYKVDIFSFLSLSLISNYSTSERFLINRRVCPQIHSLLHYKVDIFSFLTVVLIIYCSDSERFLIIGLVNRQKFFSPYPLRVKNIFYFLKRGFIKQ